MIKMRMALCFQLLPMLQISPSWHKQLRFSRTRCVGAHRLPFCIITYSAIAHPLQVYFIEDDDEVIYFGERHVAQASIDRALDNLIELDAHLNRNLGQDTNVEAASKNTLVLRMFSDNFQRSLVNSPPEHIAS